MVDREAAFVEDIFRDLGLAADVKAKAIETNYVYPDPVDFMQDHFFIPETLRPIELTPHQQTVLRAMFTQRDGKFLYSTLLYSSTKKSGKTTLAGALALWHAFRFPYSRIYLVGHDLKQADSRAADAIRVAVRLHPEWRDTVKIKPSGYLIMLPNGSSIEAIPVDPHGEAGMNPSAVFWTEAWGVKQKAGMELWTETTLSPTRQGESFRFVESYAGYVGSSPLLEHLYEMGVNQGRRVDPSIEIYVNEPASMFTYWNTSYRLPWQGDDYYREQAAVLLPNEYLRVHRNQWVASTETFIPAEWWAACRGIIEPFGKYREIVIAIDAAVSGDCFGIIGLSRKGDKVELRYCRKWTPPIGGKIEYSNVDNPDDTAYPEGELRRLAKEYNVIAFGYDPYQLHHLCTTLENDNVGYFRAFSQGADRLTADKQLYDVIRDRRFVHDGNPDLTEHIQNANAKTEGDKLRIVKRSDRMKIDLAVCASMATELAFELLPE